MFAAGPFSTTTGVSAYVPHAQLRDRGDGTALTSIEGESSPEFLPDGRHILYKTFCIGATTVFCDAPDSLGVMLADFSEPLWVKAGGMDLTDLAQGFSQVGHWVSGTR